MYNQDWEPDDRSWAETSALEAMAMERQVYAESDEALTRRLLKEASPRAVKSLLYLMDNSTNDRVILDASKYIIDRTLGKIGEDLISEEDPLMKIIHGIVEVSKENKGGDGDDGGG